MYVFSIHCRKLKKTISLSLFVTVWSDPLRRWLLHIVFTSNKIIVTIHCQWCIKYIYFCKHRGWKIWNTFSKGCTNYKRLCKFNEWKDLLNLTKNMYNINISVKSCVWTTPSLILYLWTFPIPLPYHRVNQYRLTDQPIWIQQYKLSPITFNYDNYNK